MNVYLFTLLAGLLYTYYVNTSKCVRVDTVENVDLDKFIAHTWYSQMQQEVEYQTRNSFFCVTATYNLERNRSVPYFNGKVISVYNYANYDSVNGEPMNTKNGTILCAKQLKNTDNSRLVVAPCNVPGPFGGPYWIIGVGDNYEWLVVSGGQPKHLYPDGCTTSINKTNNAGLWIFSNQPIMPIHDLVKAKNLLVNKGYTLSQLIDVKQDGCVYKQSFIK